jgi:hypothetical protein
VREKNMKKLVGLMNKLLDSSFSAHCNVWIKSLVNNTFWTVDEGVEITENVFEEDFITAFSTLKPIFSNNFKIYV